MKIKYSIKGLDCPNCAAKLAGMMAKLEGITSAKINFLTEKLTVESELPESELTAALLATAKSFSKKIELSRA
jgi:cation transport ATPase